LIVAIITGVFLEAILLAVGVLVYLDIMKLRGEIKRLASTSKKITAKSSKAIAALQFPLPVKRYLEKVLPEKDLDHRMAVLRQSGKIKVRDKYRSFNAEQYFSLERPGFIWIASVKLFKVFWINARDKYIDQKAQMLIKLLSAFRIEKRSAKELDISALIRYFMEIVWFPFLFADESKITWEAAGSDKAKGTIKDGSLSGTATFIFGKDHLVSSINTEDRFMAKKDRYIKAGYRAKLSEYKRLDGCLIPTKVCLYWVDGPRQEKTLEIEITHLRYI